MFCIISNLEKTLFDSRFIISRWLKNFNTKTVFKFGSRMNITQAA